MRSRPSPRQGTVSASTVATYMAINGDGFFNGAEADRHRRQRAGFQRRHRLHPARRFSGQRQRQPRQRRRLLSDGRAGRSKTGNPLGNVPQVLQFQNNFVPAQATTTIQYAANLPTTPTTPQAPTAPPARLRRAGGLNPSDFSTTIRCWSARRLRRFSDDYHHRRRRHQHRQRRRLPITGATLLSGSAPANSLAATSFALGDTITVDGTTITFVSTAGAAGNQLDITDTVGTLLAKIGAITGSRARHDQRRHRRDHAAHRHGANLAVTSASAGRLRAALGLHYRRSPHADRRRHRRHRRRDRQRPPRFPERNRSAAARSPPITRPERRSTCNCAGPRPTAPRSARAHQDTWNLFYQTDPTATGTQPAWINAGTNFTFGPNGALISPTGSAITIPERYGRQPVARQPHDQFRLRRPDPICQHRRHRDHQHDHAERLCRRPASVGRDQQSAASWSARSPTGRTSISPR